MAFHDLSFLIAFLPAALALFHLAQRYRPAWKGAVLLLASALFYALGDPVHLPLLAGLVLTNFVAGRVMLRRPAGRGRTLVLAAAIVLDLAVLAAYKYGWVPGQGPMATEALAVTQGQLPLGLSFFTLQQITYLVDLWRRPAPREGPLGLVDYALYSSFFAQIVVGPILRYDQAEPQYRSLSRTRVGAVEAARGLSLFTIGLTKKLLIADSIALVVDPAFAAVAAGHPPGFLEAWLVGWAYLLQLYFDFSGYSDMAIGIGIAVGLRLPINFNSPLKASSPSECFDRWHMSLVAFVRAYLFAPLFSFGRKIGRGGTAARSLRSWAAATIVSLTAIGWWHGAEGTFVLSGFLIAIVAVGYQLWSLALPRRGGRSDPGRRLGGRALVLTGLIVFGIFFRADTLDTVGVLLRSMFLPWTAPQLSFAAAMEVSPPALAGVAAGSAIALFMPNTMQIFGLFGHPGAPAVRSGPLPRWPARFVWNIRPAWAGALSLLFAAALLFAGSRGTAPVIYAQF